VPQQAQDAAARPQSDGPRPPALPFPCLLPSLASALLLWLCYFPVSWPWLGWIALVPLLSLVRSEARPRRIYFSAWLGGLVFFIAALHWITAAAHVGMYGAWIALAVYCSLYLPLGLFLVRRLDRGTRLPLIVTLPAVWSALEFMRCELFTGFGWYLLGHAQHDFLPLIQIADVTGVYGVTFLVAAVNALAFELLYRRPGFRAWLSLPANPAPVWRGVLPIQVGVLVLAFAGVIAYGAWRLNQDDFNSGPRIALLQTDLDQRLKVKAFLGTGDWKAARETITRDYTFLCLLAAKQQPAPDLIIGPESSFPRKWYEIAPSLPADKIVHDNAVKEWREEADIVRRGAVRLAAASRASLLVGANGVSVAPDGHLRLSNTAVLIQKEAGWFGLRYRVADRYDKIHRVPFGEYVPFRESLPFMNALSPYGFDFSVTAGDRQTRFPLKVAGRARPVYFGVLICYEDSDASLSRRMAVPEAGEPAADFIVNISNDGWFNGSSQHEEHLAVCRFRAVESRRAVIRAVNMGISAVIDGNGRVLEPRKKGVLGDVEIWKIDEDGKSSNLGPARWTEFKKTQGVLMASVPIDDRVSLYALWGDWLAWSCWVLVAAGLIGCWKARKCMAPVCQATTCWSDQSLCAGSGPAPASSEGQQPANQLKRS
jgi:apolipoprotein N-acyltransferase